MGPYSSNTPDPSPSPAQRVLGPLPQLLLFLLAREKALAAASPCFVPPELQELREGCAGRGNPWGRRMGKPYLLLSSRSPGVLGISLDVCHGEKLSWGLQDGGWR